MKWNPESLCFRRLMDADLPLLYGWIRHDPVVNRFWGYDHEGPYEEFVSQFAGKIDRTEPVDAYLILYGDQPIGYIQTYKWEEANEYAEFIDFTNAAGVDTFIGAAEYRNRGLGPEMLKRFIAEKVFSDPQIDRCIIDPEGGNHAAIQAYEKAGFRFLKEVEPVRHQPGPVYFMQLERSAFESGQYS